MHLDKWQVINSNKGQKLYIIKNEMIHLEFQTDQNQVTKQVGFRLALL